jgi:hypothetical protein
MVKPNKVLTLLRSRGRLWRVEVAGRWHDGSPVRRVTS